ncbi:TonB-dependent receptor [Bowmanella yangjiangensis]|uniref:TonB-dependent receptor n=1 Tax=Bowmanella yangjiangensis TaxID=2811230 RepID=A0ABS3CRW5_9ALTE|nr:TonB-dependent receptor [Bowmanella yangjiangensis]MBN7819375.1 TonB-dependent receptor [Bowmanella yangjiangensis]
MNKTFNRHLTALAIAAALGISAPALANNTSNIVGSVKAERLDDLQVTAKDPQTGYSRQIEISESGSFRFAQLPPGNYEIQITRDGAVLATQTVRLSLGVNASPSFDLSADSAERIEITGARIANVDVSTTDSGLVIGEFDIDKMPIARNMTAVALLAPGVVKGDEGFGDGNTASFGGASVAENSCYINGLEVTNTRQGLGCGSVPFEFYKEFQVKTGGYSAMFGRTTGGVVNAVTKSGTNEWEFAATANWTPAGLQEDGKASRGSGGTGNIFRDNRVTEHSEYDVTLSASGPIIEDSLFIYALVNPRNVTDKFASDIADGNAFYRPDTEYRVREASGGDNLFWGVKLDWDVNDDHRLSYFAYSDRRDVTEDIYAYNPNTGETSSDPTGVNIRKRGGEAQSLNYTGYWTDSLTVSAMAGEIETQYSTVPSNTECPSVSDSRNVPNPILGCGPGGSVGDNLDKNTQYRLDLEYAFENHLIRAGWDYQERESTRITDPIGPDGMAWTYSTLAPNASIQGIPFTNTTDQSMEIVSGRFFGGGGSFKSELTAYYIEDEWQLTDNFKVNIGVRKDIFEGDGTTGRQLYKFDTDIAPRLGFSWDINGDGESKLYATWGRYYLPVANNTIYRSASNISDFTTYYTYTGHDDRTGVPTGLTPVTGVETSSTNFTTIPVAPERAVFQTEEADPFARDELIIGYEQSLSDDLAFSVRGTYREVTSALDDYCGAYAYPFCLLVNPGKSATAFKDGVYYYGEGDPRNNLDPHDPDEDYSAFDLSDGIADPGSRSTTSAEQLGLPEANNEYLALQTEFRYRRDDLRMNFIYTWSRSTGNFEGAVKSDIDQADAGVTQDFDFPALMDGADGYQANDRRHVFKLFGSYDLNDDWSLGWNSTLASGRPLSAFGQGYPDHNPDVYGSYGDTFYIFTGQCPDSNGDGACNQDEKIYNFIPRGTVGRTPWTFNIDMSLAYRFDISGVEMRASLDVFNVLNTQEATSLNEHYEARRSEGTPNPWYGAAYSWQAPRSVRFGIEARF